MVQYWSSACFQCPFYEGRKQMKDAARPFFSRLEQDAKVLKDYEEAYGRD